MRFTTSFLRFVVGISAFLHPATALQSSSDVLVRDLSACEQAYGTGWAQCGGGTKVGCYNPGLGQVCCAVDAGHCPHGFYCASVPGKCCRKTAEECNLGVNAEVFGLPGLVGHELSGVKTMTTTKIISITITTSVMDPINMMTESQPSFVTADTDKAMLSTSECSEENLIVTTTSTSAIASDGPIRDAVTEVPGLISEIGAGPVTEILSSPAPKRPSEQTTTTTDAPDKAISIDGFWSTIPCPPPHLMSSNKTNSTASPIISSQTAGRNAGSSLALAVIMAIMASW